MQPVQTLINLEKCGGPKNRIPIIQRSAVNKVFTTAAVQALADMDKERELEGFPERGNDSSDTDNQPRVANEKYYTTPWSKMQKVDENNEDMFEDDEKKIPCMFESRPPHLAIDAATGLGKNVAVRVFLQPKVEASVFLEFMWGVYLNDFAEYDANNNKKHKNFANLCSAVTSYIAESRYSFVGFVSGLIDVETIGSEITQSSALEKFAESSKNSMEKFCKMAVGGDNGKFSNEVNDLFYHFLLYLVKFCSKLYYDLDTIFNGQRLIGALRGMDEIAAAKQSSRLDSKFIGQMEIYAEQLAEEKEVDRKAAAAKKKAESKKPDTKKKVKDSDTDDDSDAPPAKKASKPAKKASKPAKATSDNDSDAPPAKKAGKPAKAKATSDDDSDAPPAKKASKPAKAKPKATSDNDSDAPPAKKASKPAKKAETKAGSSNKSVTDSYFADNSDVEM
jgi:hypothetical protein